MFVVVVVVNLFISSKYFPTVIGFYLGVRRKVHASQGQGASTGYHFEASTHKFVGALLSLLLAHFIFAILPLLEALL